MSESFSQLMNRLAKEYQKRIDKEYEYKGKTSNIKEVINLIVNKTTEGKIKWNKDKAYGFFYLNYETKDMIYFWFDTTECNDTYYFISINDLMVCIKENGWIKDAYWTIEHTINHDFFGKRIPKEQIKWIENI